MCIAIKQSEEEHAELLMAMTLSASGLARQRSLSAIPALEGSLLTMSHSKVWKEWRKRWFTLTKDHLRVYKSKQDARMG